jgi:hypothetical protein
MRKEKPFVRAEVASNKKLETKALAFLACANASKLCFPMKVTAEKHCRHISLTRKIVKQTTKSSPAHAETKEPERKKKPNKVRPQIHHCDGCWVLRKALPVWFLPHLVSTTQDKHIKTSLCVKCNLWGLMS